jgi:hypothetical protein
MKLPFLRKATTGDEPLVLAMTGARLGEAVLFAGQSPGLALPLAARTGLSGRCLVVGPPDVTGRIEAAATREGLLVETSGQWPGDGTFDLAVVEATGDWTAAASSCRSAVRGGGRAIVVAGVAHWGLLSRFMRSGGEVVEADAVVRALTAAGWQRARAIGEREGLVFVEGFR